MVDILATMRRIRQAGLAGVLMPEHYVVKLPDPNAKKKRRITTPTSPPRKGV